MKVRGRAATRLEKVAEVATYAAVGCMLLATAAAVLAVLYVVIT
jgi:hypothetical protein